MSYFRGLLVQPIRADYDILVPLRGQGPPPEFAPR